jgi:NADH-quinone oxidoreductase subunit E
MISEKIRLEILELQKKYPEKRSALIPALLLAQSEKGYLPLEIQSQVAELFGLDLNEVVAVVSFYDMFFEKPVGKHVIHVCKNLSCMLRGSDEVLEHLCHKVKDKGGEFTVIASECLAACDRAPMMLVNEKVVGPVKVQDLDRILAEADHA